MFSREEVEDWLAAMWMSVCLFRPSVDILGSEYTSDSVHCSTLSTTQGLGSYSAQLDDGACCCCVAILL